MNLNNFENNISNSNDTSLMDTRYNEILFTETTKKNKTLNVYFSEITAKAGFKPNELNENTIYEKALNFKKILDERKAPQKILIFWPNNNSVDLILAKIFAHTIALNSEHKIDIIENSFSISHQSVISYFLSQKYNFIISFFKADKKEKWYRISFKKENFKNLSENEENQLNKKYFDDFVASEVIFDKTNLSFLSLENFESEYINGYSEFFQNKKTENKYAFYSANKDFSYALHFNKQTQAQVSLFDLKKNPEKYKKSYLYKKMEFQAKKNDAKAFFYINKENKSIVYFLKNKNIFSNLKQNDLNILFINYLKIKYGKDFVNLNFITLDTDSYYVDNFINYHKNQNIFKVSNKQELFEFKNKNDYPTFVFSRNFFSSFQSNQISDRVINPTKQMLLFIEMHEYYTQNKIDIWNELSKIHQNFSKEITDDKEFKLSHEKYLEIILEIKKQKKINNLNIKKIINFQYDSKNALKIGMKIILDNGNQILLTYNKINQILKVETFFNNKNQETIKQLILKEQEIFNFFSESTYTDLNAKNKKQIIIKFLISSLIIILIFAILFSTIYKTDRELRTGGSSLEIFQKLFSFFFQDYRGRIIFFVLILQMFFYYILNAIMIYRIMKFQSQNVKFRHVLICSMISTIVQNITPFSFGGDLISFWYLQKKNYNSHKLISVFALTSLLGQINLFISSMILLPLGFYFFQDFLFFSNNVENIMTFIFILAGITLNILFTLFIILIANFKKLQYFFIKILIFLNMKNPFNFLLDPEKKKYQYEIHFDKVKSGFSQLFSKPGLFIETLFLYKIPLTFVNFSTLIAIQIIDFSDRGWNGKDWFIWYFKFLSAQGLLGMANNLSPLPGGVGSSDWLTLVIFKHVLPFNSEQMKLFNFGNKFFFWFIPNIFSSLLLLTIWIGEKRILKYKHIKSLISLDATLNQKYHKTQTVYFKNAIILWFLLGITITLIIFLI